MTCTHIRRVIVCTFSDGDFKLPLADGRKIFLEWHHWLGPMVFRDRKHERPWHDWYDDPLAVAAMDWFIGRGKRA